MADLGITHAKPASTGRPPYDPRGLLKLYTYGYFNRIRSSRKLMIEYWRNIELFYLLNRLTPDFCTIFDFCKDNATALKQVFKALACQSMHPVAIKSLIDILENTKDFENN